MTATTLPGTYTAIYSHGSETLVLKADGSYVQEYSPVTSASVQTNCGKWEFKEKPDPIVYLDNALLFVSV